MENDITENYLINNEKNFFFAKRIVNFALAKKLTSL